MAKPESYDDARLDKIAREVFFKAMTQAKEMLASSSMNPEKLHALAAVADAAACGFEDDAEKEE